MMNAYGYLYQYLQHLCSVQQRLTHEAAAAPAVIDAAAILAAISTLRREQNA
jgi:hypothetical protein